MVWWTLKYLKVLRYFITKTFCPQKHLRMLYNSFIQSHALYGIFNWGCGTKSILEPLKRNLRKAIWVAHLAPYTTHSDPIFKRLSLLNFDKLYKLETAKFMFEINKEGSYTTLWHECLKTKNFIVTIQDNLQALRFPHNQYQPTLKGIFLHLTALNFGTLCH